MTFEFLRAFSGRLAAGSAVVLTGLLLLAPSAQAIYVGMDSFSNFEGDQTLDLRVGNDTLSLRKETKSVAVAISQHGIKMNFKIDYQTIHFNDGPVRLGQMDFDSVAGKAIAHGPRGSWVISRGTVVDRLVTKIELVGRANLRSARGFHLDVLPRTATQPIPEPGAALLFSAGLAAVSVSARRRR